MKRVILCSPLFLLMSCTADMASVRPVTIAQLEQLMRGTADSLYVFNFWATWCAPCREEMPYLERVTEEYAGDKVRVFLVSVDEERFVESQLEPFVQKHKLRSTVLWLDGGNPNSWIDRVSPEWGGNIPVTFFAYPSRGILELHDREITYEELTRYINRFNHDT